MGRYPAYKFASERTDRLSDSKALIPNCDEQDSSQFVVRSIATQAFLAVALARRRACQPAMSFTQCRLVLALLRRIITLSTCPDDFVLDPFCGCATALVAADRLQREWAGIDLSPLAIKLVNERIAGDRGLWAALRRWTHRQSERTSETCLTTGRTGIGSTASKKAFAWAARRTFHSASWTWITCCPGRRAAPTIPTTYNCSARAATGARAAGRWPNGGPRNDRQVTEAEAP